MVAGTWARRVCFRPQPLLEYLGASRFCLATRRLRSGRRRAMTRTASSRTRCLWTQRQGDFRLQPGSPAAKIGFEPWDLSDVGPRRNPLRRIRVRRTSTQDLVVHHRNKECPMKRLLAQITVLVVSLHCSSVLAATYHVSQRSPQASDAAPGTVERPWRSISKAAETVQPGDNVVIHAGVYREHVRPGRSGTAQRPSAMRPRRAKRSCSPAPT